MKTEPHFRIIEQQAFIAAVPMYTKDQNGTQAPVVVSTLTDVRVTVSVKGGAEVQGYTVSRDTNNNILLDFAHGIGLQVYSVLITANMAGRPIRTYYSEAFEGVKYNRDTTFENFITGDTITLPNSVFVLSADTLAIEVLAAQLQLAIEAAEAEKAEYARKVAELDGVAQQTTLTEGVSSIREDISHISIDTTTLAKQGTDADATLTATQTAAINAYAQAEAAKNATKDGNDTAVSVAKEIRSEVGTGSDTAAETGTLFAVVKWIKDKVVTVYNMLTDGTSGLAAIKTSAASAATDAAEAKTAAQAITGYATETNATANKNAILQAISDNAGVPTLTIPSTTASQELAPNTLYKFSSRSTALTLTLGTPITGIANEYHLFLVTDSSTAPTVTWPTGISWNGGDAPTIAADKTYEISILNNVAAFFEI